MAIKILDKIMMGEEASALSGSASKFLKHYYSLSRPFMRFMVGNLRDSCLIRLMYSKSWL
jgi:hypothetical protein